MEVASDTVAMAAAKVEVAGSTIAVATAERGDEASRGSVKGGCMMM